MQKSLTKQFLYSSYLTFFSLFNIEKEKLASLGAFIAVLKNILKFEGMNFANKTIGSISKLCYKYTRTSRRLLRRRYRGVNKTPEVRTEKSKLEKLKELKNEFVENLKLEYHALCQQYEQYIGNLIQDLSFNQLRPEQVQEVQDIVENAYGDFAERIANNQDADPAIENADPGAPRLRADALCQLAFDDIVNDIRNNRVIYENFDENSTVELVANAFKLINHMLLIHNQLEQFNFDYENSNSRAVRNYYKLYQKVSIGDMEQTRSEIQRIGNFLNRVHDYIDDRNNVAIQ